jgi:hypothetical protein
MRDRIDAAVIVGGGANVARIMIDGSLLGIADRVPHSLRRPLDELSRSYLAATRLDPYHMAPSLRPLPVLMLHARWDAIVPAATGELLWERLGRPERWTYPLGHFGLFWWLPNEAGAIADWIEDVADEATERSSSDPESDCTAAGVTTDVDPGRRSSAFGLSAGTEPCRASDTSTPATRCARAAAMTSWRRSTRATACARSADWSFSSTSWIAKSGRRTGRSDEGCGGWRWCWPTGRC